MVSLKAPNHFKTTIWSWVELVWFLNRAIRTIWSEGTKQWWYEKTNKFINLTIAYQICASNASWARGGCTPNYVPSVYLHKIDMFWTTVIRSNFMFSYENFPVLSTFGIHFIFCWIFRFLLSSPVFRSYDCQPLSVFSYKHVSFHTTTFGTSYVWYVIPFFAPQKSH